MTVEDIYKKIDKKIHLLLQVSSKLNNTYTEELQNILREFKTETLIPLSTYFETKDTKPFLNALTRTNISSVLNSLISRIPMDPADLKKINSITIPEIVIEKDTWVCQWCKCEEATFDTHRTTRLCSGCGSYEMLFCTSTDEVARKPGYQVLKHSTEWLNNIQGNDTVGLQDVVEEIKISLMNERINPKDLTYSMCRDCLKRLHKTKYNEKTVLIRSMVTGIPPSKYLESEIDIIRSDMEKIFSILNTTITNSKRKTRRVYHPYFIYKLTEIHVEPGPRQTDLLSAIHLQAPETLRMNDADWKIICQQLNYTYKATIRD
jgi:hypothetical protein